MSFKHEIVQMGAKGAVVAGIGFAALVGINSELGGIFDLPNIGGDISRPDIEGQYRAAISNLRFPDTIPVIEATVTGNSSLQEQQKSHVWGFGLVYNAVVAPFTTQNASVTRTGNVRIEAPRDAIMGIKPYALASSSKTKPEYGVEIDVNVDKLVTQRMTMGTAIDSTGHKEAHTSNGFLDRYLNVFTDSSDDGNREVNLVDFTDQTIQQECATTIAPNVPAGIQTAAIDQMKFSAEEVAAIPGKQQIAAVLNKLASVPITVKLEHANGQLVEPNAVTLPQPANMTTPAMLAKALGASPKDVHVNATPEQCALLPQAAWQQTAMQETYDQQAGKILASGGQSNG